MNPSTTRRLKRGEFLIKEGDKPDSLYVIQSGRVSLVYNRAGSHRVEFLQLQAGQVVGETALTATGPYAYSAEAATEVQVAMVPLSQLKFQFDALPEVLRSVVKGLNEKVKSLSQDVRAHRLEKETIACPQPLIPKMFGLLYLVTRNRGKNQGDEWILDWGVLSRATVRVFLDSATRMTGVLELLSKLGWVTLVSGKTSEGEIELDKVIVRNLQLIDDFAEFYQYNLYKGSRAEILYVDPICHMSAAALVQVTHTLPLDRQGVVEAPFTQLVDQIRQQTGFTFKATHLEFLEKKGLFAKRTNRPTGVSLSFDFKEFERVVHFWDIISEIDKWNETGKVDVSEKLDRFKKAPASDAATTLCPSCQSQVAESMKFCSNCGHKLAAA